MKDLTPVLRVLHPLAQRIVGIGGGFGGGDAGGEPVESVVREGGEAADGGGVALAVL